MLILHIYSRYTCDYTKYYLCRYEDAVATHSKSTTTASTEAYISLPTQSHDDDPSEVKYADP